MHTAFINNKSRIILLLLAAAVAMSVLTSVNCGAKKNYKVLKVFFDGVPDPDKAGAANTGKSASGKTSGGKGKTLTNQQEWVEMKSRHPDYYKNICNNCHDRTSSNFLKVDRKEDLCFSCHKPEKFTGSFVHGPVAVKKCNVCHLPHESRYKYLLRDKPEKLCADCHIQKAVLLQPANKAELSPPDACDKGKDCTSCHYGHVADNPFFLRKS